MEPTNRQHISQIALALPEASEVEVPTWGDHPTFRVRGKMFATCSADGSSLSLKLPRVEAEALVADDPLVEPTGYGLGRAGWVTLQVPASTTAARWELIGELIETSYSLVAPRTLVRAWEATRTDPEGPGAAHD